MHQLNLPSPVQELSEFHKDHTVYVKRDDLIHSDFGGNKWRKLKLNIEASMRYDNDVLVTFGGPFSNHIAATAASCKHYNIPSVGIIRGSFIDDNNPTLVKAKKDGMLIYHVTKEDYSLKFSSEVFRKVVSAYRNPLTVPEGGGNALAIEGVKELGREIVESELGIKYIVVAGGTGTTAIGIIQSVGPNIKTVVINALRNQSLSKVIEEKVNHNNWEVRDDFHCGGFAKTNPELKAFVQNFYDGYRIALDPIYNAKMLLATQKLCDENYFEKDQPILCIHTGGLQGITAWNYRHQKAWIKT